jgi:release factor glutamine methyltransferase
VTVDSLHERIDRARERLERAGINRRDARFDAEVLARHALGWDRTQLLVRGRDLPPDHFDDAFEGFIARRAEREPVALIIGRREFWGLDFEVTGDTLIPRPESELLVEEALGIIGSRPGMRAYDVGTGTGCLAVAIAHERRDCRIVATDISRDALSVARRNADRHGVSDRIRFVCANLLDGLHGRVDVIVSNPPYVPDSDVRGLSREVAGYEPHSALFGGPDGFVLMRHLLATAGGRLATDGRLVLEFGFGQESAVSALAVANGWQVERVRADLQGLPRTLVLRR